MQSTMRFSVVMLFAATALAQSNGCSGQQYNTLPGFPSTGNCYPNNYLTAMDLGNTNPTDATTRCTNACNSNSACTATVAALNKAADSGLYSGSCYFYGASSVPTGPRKCDSTNTYLVGIVKDFTNNCFSTSLAAASTFCSSYLGIPVSTVYTTTTPPVTSITSTLTSTSVISQTQTNTQTLTSYATVTTSVSTVMVPSTYTITSTSTMTVNAKRKAKRTAAAPACVSSVASTRLSTACSCLSVSTSTTTSTIEAPTPTYLTSTTITMTTSTTAATVQASTTTTITSSVVGTTTVTVVTTTTTTTTSTVTSSPTATTCAQIGSKYTATNGEVFNTNCGHYNAYGSANIINRYYVQNFRQCLELCAANSACKAVGMALESGQEACALLKYVIQEGYLDGYEDAATLQT